MSVKPRALSGALFLAAFFPGALSPLLAQAAGTAAGAASAKAPRVLVVSFSRVGTSKPFVGVDMVASASLPAGNALILAGLVRAAVGGDAFQITTVEPYPAVYRETTDQALKEQDAKARPKLASRVPDLAAYDTVFLVYPDWWGTLPMPLFTFLESYDFSGKTLVPLCTHEGSGLGRSEKDIAKLCPRSKLLPGLAVYGSDAAAGKAGKTVDAWLAKLGYGKKGA